MRRFAVLDEALGLNPTTASRPPRQQQRCSNRDAIASPVIFVVILRRQLLVEH